MSKTNQPIEDDIYLEILTLGLIGKLKRTNGITALNIEKRIPCNRLTICGWEQFNGISLPADLKEFYSSTDGFFVAWKYQKDGEEASGEIKIYSLSNVRRINLIHQRKLKGQLSDNICKTEPYLKSSLTMNNSHLNRNSNISMAFVLSHHHNVGTICLVYNLEKEPQNSIPTNKFNLPSIWMLDVAHNWHFLANDFSSYFRMMLAHVGLEQWQFKFTSFGLTTICRRMMAIIIPYLLHSKSNENVYDDEQEMEPNIINNNIFKMECSTLSKMNKPNQI